MRTISKLLPSFLIFCLQLYIAQQRRDSKKGSFIEEKWSGISRWNESYWNLSVHIMYSTGLNKYVSMPACSAITTKERFYLSVHSIQNVCSAVQEELQAGKHDNRQSLVTKASRAGGGCLL